MTAKSPRGGTIRAQRSSDSHETSIRATSEVWQNADTVATQSVGSRAVAAKLSIVANDGGSDSSEDADIPVRRGKLLVRRASQEPDVQSEANTSEDSDVPIRRGKSVIRSAAHVRAVESHDDDNIPGSTQVPRQRVTSRMRSEPWPRNPTPADWAAQYSPTESEHSDDLPDDPPIRRSLRATTRATSSIPPAHRVPEDETVIRGPTTRAQWRQEHPVDVDASTESASVVANVPQRQRVRRLKDIADSEVSSTSTGVNRGAHLRSSLLSTLESAGVRVDSESENEYEADELDASPAVEYTGAGAIIVNIRPSTYWSDVPCIYWDGKHGYDTRCCFCLANADVGGEYFRGAEGLWGHIVAEHRDQLRELGVTPEDVTDIVAQIILPHCCLSRLTEVDIEGIFLEGVEDQYLKLPYGSTVQRQNAERFFSIGPEPEWIEKQNVERMRMQQHKEAHRERDLEVDLQKIARKNAAALAAQETSLLNEPNDEYTGTGHGEPVLAQAFGEEAAMLAAILERDQSKPSTTTYHFVKISVNDEQLSNHNAARNTPNHVYSRATPRRSEKDAKHAQITTPLEGAQKSQAALSSLTPQRQRSTLLHSQELDKSSSGAVSPPVSQGQHASTGVEDDFEDDAADADLELGTSLSSHQQLPRPRISAATLSHSNDALKSFRFYNGPPALHSVETPLPTSVPASWYPRIKRFNQRIQGIDFAFHHLKACPVVSRELEGSKVVKDCLVACLHCGANANEQGQLFPDLRALVMHVQSKHPTEWHQYWATHVVELVQRCTSTLLTKYDLWRVQVGSAIVKVVNGLSERMKDSEARNHEVDRKRKRPGLSILGSKTKFQAVSTDKQAPKRARDV